MPVTMQGTIPYPANAEARPIVELATKLNDLGRTLGTTVDQLGATRSRAAAGWRGQAAQAFGRRVSTQTDVVDDVARLLQSAVPVLRTFAAAITASQAAYSTAVAAEQAARAGLPYTAAAYAAALGAEQAAVLTLQGAGVACGMALGAIEIRLAAKQFADMIDGDLDGKAEHGTTIWDALAERVIDWTDLEDPPANGPTRPIEGPPARIERPIPPITDGLPPTAIPMTDAGTAPADQVPRPQTAAPTGPYGLFDQRTPGIMDRLMRDFNLTEQQAAAIMGNLGHESRGFRALQEERPTVRGSRGGWGWAQWTGPRRRAFEAYAAQNGLDPSSEEANYGFLAHELRGTHRRAITDLRRATGFESQVQVFERRFEGAGIKHYDQRQDWAERALRVYRESRAATPTR